MRLSGYTNPIRSFERQMAPDYASRELRDPGLRPMHSETGLGSLRHTMPHLMPAMRLQAGGGAFSNPVGRLYASARPNLYNPDPFYRQILASQRNLQFTDPSFRAMPFSDTGLVYADGGAAPDEEEEPEGGSSPSDLEEPDEDLSAPDQQRKQIVAEAMLALEGRHPDPEQAIDRFLQIFGRRGLAELMQMIREQGSDQEEQQDTGGGYAPQQDQELEAAGGGLLQGRGTGQSDEIEGSTPSGRKVLLSDGEYVIDAPTVAALGDGSTAAGAKRLDEFRKSIRQQAHGNDRQAKPMKNGGRAIVIELGG